MDSLVCALRVSLCATLDGAPHLLTHSLHLCWVCSSRALSATLNQPFFFRWQVLF